MIEARNNYLNVTFKEWEDFLRFLGCIYKRYSQVHNIWWQNHVYSGKPWFTWRTYCMISFHGSASYCLVYHVLICTWRLYAARAREFDLAIIHATRVPANVTDASDSSRTCRNCRRSPARCTSSRSFPARCRSS